MKFKYIICKIKYFKTAIKNNKDDLIFNRSSTKGGAKPNENCLPKRLIAVNNHSISDII